MYATFTDYQAQGGQASEQDITPKLQAASDAVDALTFNRIVGKGFENLTTFQQEKVKRFCCLQADFLLENADAVESAMTHYSINGVTMEFGNAALYQIVEGLAVSNAAISLLNQTGLTSRLLTPKEVEPCVTQSW